MSNRCDIMTHVRWLDNKMNNIWDNKNPAHSTTTIYIYINKREWNWNIWNWKFYFVLFCWKWHKIIQKKHFFKKIIKINHAC